MYLFHNDYNSSCHPAVFARLAEQNVSMPGYGVDECCVRAAQLIRNLCQNDALAVHFLMGGTQTNLTVIAAALRPHQAVIAADSGHVNVHETGAIEATGHKIISVPNTEGKILPQQVEEVYLSQFLSADAEHMTQPKLVYISNPTEFGTTYSLRELTELSEVCHKCGLFLFVDGARLGYALGSDNYDVTLADLARLADAFYIGGTKCGAMFGEAVIIANPIIAEDFRYIIKQRGAMIAKGWLLGLQFEALLENNLYTKICRQADIFADQIRKVLNELGYLEICANRTNQIFVSLPNSLLQELGKEFTYAVWSKDSLTHTTVRFCASWATKAESVEALCAALRRLHENERGDGFV